MMLLGLEGTFRLSCIEIMQTMRDNRQLLEILLEHFVYDPLIDWRVQSGTHESTLIPLYVINPSLAARCSSQKRKIEMDSTFQLFQLRRSELGPDWSENRIEMSTTVQQLRETAANWLTTQNQIEKYIYCYDLD